MTPFNVIILTHTLMLTVFIIETKIVQPLKLLWLVYFCPRALFFLFALWKWFILSSFSLSSATGFRLQMEYLVTKIITFLGYLCLSSKIIMVIIHNTNCAFTLCQASYKLYWGFGHRSFHAIISHPVMWVLLISSFIIPIATFGMTYKLLLKYKHLIPSKNIKYWTSLMIKGL